MTPSAADNKAHALRPTHRGLLQHHFTNVIPSWSVPPSGSQQSAQPICIPSTRVMQQQSTTALPTLQYQPYQSSLRMRGVTPCDQGSGTCCAPVACLPAPRCGCGCACPACASFPSCVSSPSGSSPFCASCCCCCAPCHDWTAPCGDASAHQHSSKGRKEVLRAVQQTIVQLPRHYGYPSSPKPGTQQRVLLITATAFETSLWHTRRNRVQGRHH